MPLIIISGYPSSGKTYRAQQIQAYCQSRIRSSEDARASRLSVHLVNDQSLGLGKDVYQEARSEKDARATQYSAIKRLLGKDAIVIADGLNYIKGFRYQLYCEAKAARTPSCVVHVGTPVEKCREINSKDDGYQKDMLENLIFRYEEPNGMTRWDSPLFTVPYDDETPPCDAIWEALVGSEGSIKTARPNAATVDTPAPESDYLYSLDQTTQTILNRILEWQKDHPGESGGEISFDEDGSAIELPARPVSLPQLQRIRRQFITMSRQHRVAKPRIRASFTAYLNDNL